MKITYIKMFNKKRRDESMLMKHLRDDTIKKEIKSEAKKESSDSTRTLFKDIKKWVGKNVKDKEKIKEIFSNKIIKKNQALLIATSLMLVTAGYLNYTNTIKMAELGDAQLVSANITKNNESEEVISMFENEEVIETSTSNEENTLKKNEIEINDTDKDSNNEYFTKTKLEREKMYSQMIESYQKILEKNNMENNQKEIASNEIKNINERKNAIATIENLIKVKGIEDVVVLINGNSINVVVKSKDNLDTTKIAQIQNIVSRELNAEIEDIHITTHE